MSAVGTILLLVVHFVILFVGAELIFKIAENNKVALFIAFLSFLGIWGFVLSQILNMTGLRPEGGTVFPVIIIR